MTNNDMVKIKVSIGTNVDGSSIDITVEAAREDWDDMSYPERDVYLLKCAIENIGWNWKRVRVND